MTFTHLQVKSGYSLMKSVNKITPLVEKAKEKGFTALALTDESVLHGIIPFYKACKKTGIKPILGMTIEIGRKDRPAVHCVLLAADKTGYQNLLKLSTHISRKKEKVIMEEELSFYTDGIIGILSASAFLTTEQLASGKVSEKAFTDWKGSFDKDSLYMSMDLSVWQQSSSFQSLLLEIDRNFLPVVAIGDVRYLEENDYAAYECLEAMREGQHYQNDNEREEKSRLHLMSAEEAEKIMPQELMKFLERAGEIADRCDVAIDLDKQMLPSYPVPGSETPFSYLEDLCKKAMRQKTSLPNREIEERLEYELAVIEKMGFSDYFLIVWDFINYAKKQGIVVGPGRGSAAGSFVAYLLNITNVDPLKYDLLFERFLNPERVSMPDIDIDFSDHRREEVIQYVKDKYGEEHVAQIVTFGTFGTKSLLRELIKALDVDPQDAAFVLKEVSGNTSKPLSAAVKSSRQLVDYIKQSSKLKTLFKIAVKLEGLPRHVSTHAAGVVISEKPLVEYVPLMEGNEGVFLTQFAMGELEAVGLLKMDFLGLRNLTLMEQLIKSINYATERKLTLEEIPFNDTKTFRLLQTGKTNGIFQLESHGMKGVLKQLKPTEFEDVVVVNALYRPGPMEYIPVYAERKQGRQPVTYPHVDLKPILKNTYGVLVYQEQIMQIASKIAGFSMGEADILRRAVSKKQSSVMEEQKEKFLKGCLAKGYEKETAEEIFHWIVRFSDYGFNRSHAVAYSMISFQLAYLKTHYPSFFLAELMSSVTGNNEKLQSYTEEAKEFGLIVLPPSVNRSYGKFSVEKNGIRFGLFSIKGIGNQAVKAILQERKKNGLFKDLYDFCRRIPNNAVSRPIIESLIKAGAFDEFYQNRASQLATIDQALEQGELFSEFESQSSFFQQELEADYADVEEFSPLKKLELEKQVLGFYLSSHPLADYRNRLQKAGYITLEQGLYKINPKQVRMAVSVQEIKKIRTKRGESMAFLKVSDETAQSEAVVFPEIFRNVHRWLEEEMLIVLTGKLENRNGRKQWIASELSLMDEKELLPANDVRLYIQLKNIEKDTALEEIRQTAASYPGAVTPIIYEASSKKTYQLSGEFGMDGSRDNLLDLKKIFGEENVVTRKRKEGS